MGREGEIKFVLDTVSYVQVFMSPNGTASQLIKKASNQGIKIYLSSEIFNELKSTLYNLKSWQKIDISEEEINSKVSFYLNTVIEYVVKAELVTTSFPYPRDPKDEKIINLAIDTGSDIVTRDKDLLSLQNPVSTEEKKEANRLKEIAPDLSIRSPEEALHQLTQFTES